MSRVPRSSSIKRRGRSSGGYMGQRNSVVLVSGVAARAHACRSPRAARVGRTVFITLHAPTGWEEPSKWALAGGPASPPFMGTFVRGPRRPIVRPGRHTKFCAFLADCRGGRWSGASCAPRSSSVPHTLRRCRARPSPRPAAPRAPLPPLNGRLHVASRSCFGAALCPRTSGATLLPDCAAPRRLRRDARRAAAAQRPPRATAAPAVAADMQPRPSSPFRNGAS